VKEATREVRGKVRTINLCQKKYRKCRIKFWACTGPNSSFAGIFQKNPQSNTRHLLQKNVYTGLKVENKICI